MTGTVRSNVVANFAGSIWSALMGLAFVPIYIRLMGVESYALVGVFTALMGILAVLDMGLSQTMNREMARRAAEKVDAHAMANMARTLELIYWAIAAGVVAVIVLLSNFIAYHWLSPEQLSRDSLRQSLWIMALVIGLRWPAAIYLGGLNGLQRQVMVNVLSSLFATLQGVGALAVLWFVEPTIQAFFMWQAIVALLQVMTLRFALWRSLPAQYPGKFSWEVLSGIWRFAAGITGISLVATLLTQLDKILLSKLLTLTEFGYYTFAAVVAAMLFRLIGPVYTAYYPRLTELVSQGDQLAVVKVYHQGCQLMAVAILPATLLLVFFSREILQLWTQNPGMVEHASLLVSLLVVGNALNGLMHMPYALQLAHGWTKLAFSQNLIAVIILVPAMYWATLGWGAAGAAVAWIVLNSGYILIGVQVMHRRLLVGEKGRWYVSDVGKPLLSALTVMALSMGLMADDLSAASRILVIAAVLLLSYVTTIASADRLREKVVRKWPFWRGQW